MTQITSEPLLSPRLSCVRNCTAEHDTCGGASCATCPTKTAVTWRLRPVPRVCLNGCSSCWRFCERGAPALDVAARRSLSRRCGPLLHGPVPGSRALGCDTICRHLRATRMSPAAFGHTVFTLHAMDRPGRRSRVVSSPSCHHLAKHGVHDSGPLSRLGNEALISPDRFQLLRERGLRRRCPDYSAHRSPPVLPTPRLAGRLHPYKLPLVIPFRPL